MLCSDDVVLTTLRNAMQTIIGDNTHLTERCEAMLAALNGPLAAPLEPTYDELNPPPEPKKEYRFSLGDTVYLGTQEYEMLSFDEQTVRLYDPSFPLINKELPREEFDRLLAENPLNDHLLVPIEAEAQPEAPNYALGYGYLGNGVTVWNRLEQEHGDYKTVAHIDPDRTVQFYDDRMPEDIRAEIRQFAATANLTISATQDAPVFSTPSQKQEPVKRQEQNDFADIDPAAVRAALAARGIVDGHVADPDKLAASPFIQQVMADVEQIAANEPPPYVENLWFKISLPSQEDKREIRQKRRVHGAV